MASRRAPNTKSSPSSTTPGISAGTSVPKSAATSATSNKAAKAATSAKAARTAKAAKAAKAAARVATAALTTTADPLPEPSANELSAEAERLDAAEVLLGHTFRDRAHLLRALTHRSWLNEHRAAVAHNEVLEFLGDSVLSIVVVDDLVRASPGADEGELTERRAAHVSTEALAKVAIAKGLDSLVRVGRGVRVDDAVPVNIAADVVEAAFGAVWLDTPEAPFEACQKVVRALLGPPPTTAPAITAHSKRVLQERTQRVFGKAPDYDIRRLDGPSHAPRFVAEVRFRGHLLGSGEGGNKRVATEEAARLALEGMEDVDDVGLRERLR